MASLWNASKKKSHFFVWLIQASTKRFVAVCTLAGRGASLMQITVQISLRLRTTKHYHERYITLLCKKIITPSHKRQEQYNAKICPQIFGQVTEVENRHKSTLQGFPLNCERAPCLLVHSAKTHAHFFTSHCFFFFFWKACNSIKYRLVCYIWCLEQRDLI